MPRDGNGTYSLPAGYEAITGQTIEASQHNPPLEDIRDALTASLPRNGAAPMTGALAMGSNAITGVAGITLTSGALNTVQGADIASATTTDIGAATGNYVVITGTTTITGLGTAPAGRSRMVRFAASLTLTHNATSLILPGAANIVTAAGDVAEFISEGSGNWRCLVYTRANAQPVTGIQQAPVRNTLTTYTSLAPTIPVDDTIPQSGEGTEILAATITPRLTTSRLYVEGVVPIASDNAALRNLTVAIFRDSEANATRAYVVNVPVGSQLAVIPFKFSVPSTATTATTFKIRVGANTGSCYINGTASGRLLGGAQAAEIIVTEIL
jgi:hypothetical protein